MNAEKSPNKKVLIISNNVLSHTRNNGKTILSFIDGLDAGSISQLYFNGEKPSVAGYSYYQLSDRDVIKGIFNANRRGRFWNNFETDEKPDAKSGGSVKKRPSPLARLARDILWLGRWKSKKLISWLDKNSPDVIFFVAGDSGFSYNIVKYVAGRYKARLVTYITDDYIMPRSREKLIDKIRRFYIRRKMLSCISRSDAYFTVSGIMQKEYGKLTGKQSKIIMNMTPPLLDENLNSAYSDCERRVMIYTGSLYYGRDGVLGRIAEACEKYNLTCNEEKEKVAIKIYSNSAVTEEGRTVFERECCKFCGSLNPTELKEAFNSADVLLFVESFDPMMQEKTRYSLSTKVPEYMSVRKPIFAVGPSGIGSIDYLSDVAFCAFSEDEIEKALFEMLTSPKRCEELSLAAVEKYNKYHDTKKQKHLFLENCFGESFLDLR